MKDKYVEGEYITLWFPNNDLIQLYSNQSQGLGRFYISNEVKGYNVQKVNFSKFQNSLILKDGSVRLFFINQKQINRSECGIPRNNGYQKKLKNYLITTPKYKDQPLKIIHTQFQDDSIFQMYEDFSQFNPGAYILDEDKIYKICPKLAISQMRNGIVVLDGKFYDFIEVKNLFEDNPEQLQKLYPEINTDKWDIHQQPILQDMSLLYKIYDKIDLENTCFEQLYDVSELKFHNFYLQIPEDPELYREKVEIRDVISQKSIYVNYEMQKIVQDNDDQNDLNQEEYSDDVSNDDNKENEQTNEFCVEELTDNELFGDQQNANGNETMLNEFIEQNKNIPKQIEQFDNIKESIAQKYFIHPIVKLLSSINVNVQLDINQSTLSKFDEITISKILDKHQKLYQQLQKQSYQIQRKDKLQIRKLDRLIKFDSDVMLTVFYIYKNNMNDDDYLEPNQDEPQQYYEPYYKNSDENITEIIKFDNRKIGQLISLKCAFIRFLKLMIGCQLENNDNKFQSHPQFVLIKSCEYLYICYINQLEGKIDEWHEDIKMTLDDGEPIIGGHAYVKWKICKASQNLDKTSYHKSMLECFNFDCLKKQKPQIESNEIIEVNLLNNQLEIESQNGLQQYHECSEQEYDDDSEEFVKKITNQVTNILDLSKEFYHRSYRGTKHCLVLKQIENSEFQISHISFRHAKNCQSQLKTGIIFVSQNKLKFDQLNIFNHIKYENLNEAVKQSNQCKQFQVFQIEENDQIELDLFSLTQSWYRGRFITIKFIDAHGLNTCIELGTLGILGTTNMELVPRDIGPIAQKFRVIDSSIPLVYFNIEQDSDYVIRNNLCLIFVGQHQNQIEEIAFNQKDKLKTFNVNGGDFQLNALMIQIFCKPINNTLVILDMRNNSKPKKWKQDKDLNCASKEEIIEFINSKINVIK